MSAILRSFLTALAKQSGKIITGGLTLGAVTAATGGGELPSAVARLITPRPAPITSTEQIKATENVVAQLQAQNPRSASIEGILGSIDPRLAALLLGGGAAAAGGLALSRLRRRRGRRAVGRRRVARPRRRAVRRVRRRRRR